MKKKKVKLYIDSISKKPINKYLNQVEEESEPYHSGICYPQADDIEKVRILIEVAYRGYTTKEELKEIMNITLRQVDYYGNAARYLGFITRKGGLFLATQLGQKLAQLNKLEKEQLILERLFAIPSIRKIFQSILTKPLSKDIVITSMHRAEVYLNTEKMENRRAKTIFSWVCWAINKLPNLT